FPDKLQKRVLRGRQPITDRAGLHLAPVDVETVRTELEHKLQQPMTELDALANLMYPRVFPDLVEHQKKFSDTSVLPTPTFFFGMEKGEEIGVEIEPGKTLIIKFLTVGDPHADGKRLVSFELNGIAREVLVLDHALVGKGQGGPVKAEVGNPLHIGAPMPGAVVAGYRGTPPEQGGGENSGVVAEW